MLSNHVMAQTGESDQNGSNILSASPNPFDGEVTLTIHECTNKKLVMITISDIIAAKDILVIDLKNKSGVLTYKLDTSKLRPGVYFCNVYGENGVIETKKLFKTHILPNP
jgi:hypothetical protein